MMTQTSELYSNRITKIYLEYLERNYPEIDIDEVLDYAGITRHEVEAPSYWFAQDQMDRLHEILVRRTGNPSIAREGGRFGASTQSLGPAKKYLLGLLNPSSMYMLMGKVYDIFSRAATVKTRKLGNNRVEITATPKPGVQEKPYQCENRLGMFESAALLFTQSYAKVEHPQCIHRGDGACRYLVQWRESRFFRWKRLRNLLLAATVPVSLGLLGFVSASAWAVATLAMVALILVFEAASEYLEKKELIETVRTQGNVAKELIEEMNIRHNHALLVQEIGKATSTILKTEDLFLEMVDIMKKHLDFDRGLILLADPEKKLLVYAAGYGYEDDKEKLLLQITFHLDKPDSRGIFVQSFREQKSILVNDFSEIENSSSPKSVEFAKAMGASSLICVPIVYKGESYGILTVDNLQSKNPLTQSDVNLLNGVAAQTAISIVNAMSFQRLQESEKSYRELVEHANSIIMRIDTRGNILFFNTYAQKLFGYPEHYIIGENLAGTILPDTEETRWALQNRLDLFRENPERVVNEEAKAYREGEALWIAWNYKPVCDAEGRFREILCIGNDVTELKKAEIEKRDLANRLQRAEKMEALGTMAGGVAHDLNNILAGLVSYPELLLMELPPDSKLRSPILTIKKSGEKAASIVQDLLTLARRGVSVTEVVNLNQIVKDYINSPENEQLRVDHPDVHIQLELDPDLMNINGSPVHLSKTVMNLVFNAAEAMPEGGRISLSTGNCYVDMPISGFDKVDEGDYVLLSVDDSGIGIAADDLERIFEPFYTKKVMGRSGTGLGMAVVWGTVKDHKGYIDVQSTEGEGTRFSLYFPVTRKLRERREAFTTDERLAALRGNGEKILIVDDVAEQREIATWMLTKLGYTVYSVDSGEAALEYLTDHEVDLLILDMIMEPGLDGLDTYRRIVEWFPHQKAVIVSGYSESDRVKKLQSLGAGTYVKKPFVLEDIGRAVKSELGKR